MPELNYKKNKFWTTEKKLRYENAMALLLKRIEHIDDEIYKKNGNHIIRHTEKRIKSEESIAEKIRRKNKNVTKNTVESLINDLAGVRVICFDTRQVYTLVKEVRKLNDFAVIKEKDYITHPKENGYQSYHIILEFLGLKVELQIRTIVMDAWSSLDTILVYKKTNNPPQEIVEKIQKFSKWSKKIDSMVEELLEEHK